MKNFLIRNNDLTKSFTYKNKTIATYYFDFTIQHRVRFNDYFVFSSLEQLHISKINKEKLEQIVKKNDKKINYA